jgi:hypothetical protein
LKTRKGKQKHEDVQKKKSIIDPKITIEKKIVHHPQILLFISKNNFV